jgi:hypothetical protein
MIDRKRETDYISRRGALKFLYALAGGAALAGCLPGQTESTEQPPATRTSIPELHTQVPPTQTPEPPKTSTPTETATEAPELTATPENYEDVSVFNVPIESVGCIDVRLCFNLEPKDGNEMYKQLVTALAVSPEQQAYWRNFGLEYTGSSDDKEAMEKAGQKVLEFLRNNVGGPEEASYWLPAVAKDGTEFRILVGRGGDLGQFDLNAVLKNQLKEARRNNDPEAIKNIGVYLDRIPFAAFSLGEWQNNPEKHDYFDKILKENWRLRGATLNDAGSDRKPFNLSGLVVSQNRLMFVIGSQRMLPPEVQLPWTEDIKQYVYLGGPNGVFREDVDPEIATADWLTYTKLTAIWDENPHPVEPNGPIAAYGDQARYHCIVWNPVCNPLVRVKDLSPEDSLFQPIK